MERVCWMPELGRTGVGCAGWGDSDIKGCQYGKVLPAAASTALCWDHGASPAVHAAGVCW